MFKVVDMGAIEERKCFALTGDEELAQTLAREMTPVQRAAAAGMPTCDILVSLESREPNLHARMRIPQRYSAEQCLQRDLSFAQWRKAIAGNFDFLQEELYKSALRLLLDTPDFFRERVVRQGDFRLYVPTEAVRAALQMSLAEIRLPESPVLTAPDMCLLLRNRQQDAVLSVMSDSREAILGTYAQECLFASPDSPECVLWQLLNEWILDACGADLAGALLHTRGEMLSSK